MKGGRQREFDKELALENAMYVFWKKGYVGASLTDLTTGMGINKPSMYAAFGNKESLFISATDHYLEKYAKPANRLLHTDGVPLKQRVIDYLTAIVANQCDSSKPCGCFISMSVTEAAGETIPEKALEAISTASGFSETYLTQFFQQEIQLDNLSSQYDANDLAVYFLTLLHGTAAQSRNGKSAKQLQSIINTAVNQLSFEPDAKTNP
ncbi:TetR/AcrR family transcriptional regulator [Aliikangiella coralliicola]|nr:TetR/AcrR family transcriptional regulator [Aliikangiella coralliicola]